MSDQIFNLFPQSIMICDKVYNLNEQELEYIKSLEKEKNYGGGENDKTILSYILNNPTLKNLKEYFEKQINHYMHNHMEYSENYKFYITQSWANFNEKETFHHKHNHANSILSGVYYIGFHSAAIRFYKNFNTFPLQFEVKNYNIVNSKSWFFAPQKNNLFLFPSQLEHSVEANENNEPRISIAFNSFVKGKIGSEKDLTELNITDDYKNLLR